MLRKFLILLKSKVKKQNPSLRKLFKQQIKYNIMNPQRYDPKKENYVPTRTTEYPSIEDMREVRIEKRAGTEKGLRPRPEALSNIKRTLRAFRGEKQDWIVGNPS